ncbi:MAG: hypothetical protein KGJ06_06010 [Pseudomonadota bacterium]|nr:hypothetical protein [Pseudomonadota bacterium]
MENNQCSSQGCLGKWISSSIVVFVLLFIMGYLIHHVWLMPIYQQTAALWRPMGQMQQFFPLMLGYYAGLSVVIAALFCKVSKAKMAACAGEEAECRIGGKHCPIKYGICFGVLIGLLMGIQSAGAYIWMPIPSELAIDWLIGNVVQGIVIGVALSLICYFKKKHCAK